MIYVINICFMVDKKKKKNGIAMFLNFNMNKYILVLLEKKNNMSAPSDLKNKMSCNPQKQFYHLLVVYFKSEVALYIKY